MTSSALRRLQADLMRWSTRRPRRIAVCEQTFDTKRQRLRAQKLVLRLRLAQGRAVQSVSNSDGTQLFIQSHDAGQATTSGTVHPWLTGCVGPVDRAVRKHSLGVIRRVCYVAIHYAHCTSTRQHRVSVAQTSDPDALRAQVTLHVTPADRRQLLLLAQAVIVQYRGRLALPIPAAEEPSSLSVVEKCLATAREAALSPRQAFAAVGWRQLRLLVAQEAAVFADSAPALHDMRLALRRLRSALAVFSDALPSRERERFAAELRWVASQLALARDLDVFRSLALARLQRSKKGRSMLDALSRPSHAALRVARRRARLTLASLRYRVLLLDLLVWFESLSTGEDTGDQSPTRTPGDLDRLLQAQARRRLRRILRDGRQLRSMDTAARHELRIRTRKLRHCLEFSIALPTSSHLKDIGPALLKELLPLQAALGSLHDMQRSRAIGLRLASKLKDDECRPLVPARLVRRWSYSRRASHSALQRAATCLRRLARQSL